MKKQIFLILVMLFLLCFCSIASSEQEITNDTPFFSMDTSALPFIQIAWNTKLNTLSKDLGIKPEKEGSASLLRTTVSIPDIGNDLPVTYSFRNNKLASVSVTINTGLHLYPDFKTSNEKEHVWNYINSFIGDHPRYTYLARNTFSEYTITDVTEINYGLLKNGGTYNLAMEFFPSQPYDASILKKNKKISSKSYGENGVIYFDSDPYFFTHEYTSKMNRFTYSYFNWSIVMQESMRDIGRIPVLLIYFSYAGVGDSSVVNEIKFSMDNVVYQFKIDALNKQKMFKTAFNELSQTFILQIDRNNYTFLEKLSKAKKVRVNLHGRGFALYFDLPANAKKKLVQGMQNYEKVCGIVDGPLSFNRSNGTRLTVE